MSIRQNRPKAKVWQIKKKKYRLNKDQLAMEAQSFMKQYLQALFYFNNSIPQAENKNIKHMNQPHKNQLKHRRQKSTGKKLNRMEQKGIKNGQRSRSKKYSGKSLKIYKNNSVSTYKNPNKELKRLSLGKLVRNKSSNKQTRHRQVKTHRNQHQYNKSQVHQSSTDPTIQLIKAQDQKIQGLNSYTMLVGEDNPEKCDSPTVGKQQIRVESNKELINKSQCEQILIGQQSEQEIKHMMNQQIKQNDNTNMSSQVTKRNQKLELVCKFTNMFEQSKNRLETEVDRLLQMFDMQKDCQSKHISSESNIPTNSHENQSSNIQSNQDDTQQNKSIGFDFDSFGNQIAEYQIFDKLSYMLKKQRDRKLDKVEMDLQQQRITILQADTLQQDIMRQYQNSKEQILKNKKKFIYTLIKLKQYSIQIKKKDNQQAVKHYGETKIRRSLSMGNNFFKEILADVRIGSIRDQHEDYLQQDLKRNKKRIVEGCFSWAVGHNI